MHTHLYRLLLALIALIALIVFLVTAAHSGSASPAEAWAEGGAFTLVMGGFFTVIQVLGGKK